jgi:hypothetical protein
MRKMSRLEMVYKVAHTRGLEDRYTLLIARYAEDSSISDREIQQLMFDILLGVDDLNED